MALFNIWRNSKLPNPLLNTHFDIYLSRSVKDDRRGTSKNGKGQNINLKLSSRPTANGLLQNPRRSIYSEYCEEVLTRLTKNRLLLSFEDERSKHFIFSKEKAKRLGKLNLFF